MGIQTAVVIGPDEAAAGNVTVKDLAGREQKTIALSALVEEIKAHAG